MVKNNEKEFDQLFANWEEWIKNYGEFSDYFTGELQRINKGEPKLTNKEETHDILIGLARGLVRGACRLQYVGERGFYFEDDDLEVVIHFKGDYSNVSLKERPSHLIDEVMVLLETEGDRFREISSTYEKK